MDHSSLYQIVGMASDIPRLPQTVSTYGKDDKSSPSGNVATTHYNI